MTGIDAIRQRAPGFEPEIGVILGSGLAGFADCVNQPTVIAYDEIDGFPACTNKSHKGELVLGHVAGRAVACLNGRAHLYEGVEPARQAVPVRTLASLEGGALEGPQRGRIAPPPTVPHTAAEVVQ